MNTYYLAAAAAAFLLGLAHTVLGERLIFSRLRADKARGVPVASLKDRHVAALWSTWHLLTLFGWGLAATFVWMAYPDAEVATLGLVLAALLLLCAVFWLFGTRGRHPAWIVFLLAAALSWFGSMAD